MSGARLSRALRGNPFQGRRFTHYVEIDASLLKRVSLNERFKLEVRADATNLTNTVAFGAPTTDITSGTFGRIRNSAILTKTKIRRAARITTPWT